MYSLGNPNIKNLSPPLLPFDEYYSKVMGLFWNIVKGSELSNESARFINKNMFLTRDFGTTILIKKENIFFSQ